MTTLKTGGEVRAKPAKTPCSTCPYRRDVPSGIWEAGEYGKLCLAQGERILTADLIWHPAGDVREGDVLFGFEADTGSRVTNRRHQPSVVIRSEAAARECVRVILSDGTSVTCTTDHPWLVQNSADHRRFLAANRLLTGLLTGRGDRRRVVRLFDTWPTDTSRDGGWLAGMYDGEGSLRDQPDTFGCRLSLHQNPGSVLDRAEALLLARGFKIYRHEARARAVALDINATSEVVRALGSLRPIRLLPKFRIDRACHALDTPEVIAVEPTGIRDIQVITTSVGTYIGEGFAMHNCGYDSDVPDQIMAGATGLFFCHQRDGHLCAGWVGCHDMVNNFAVRMHAGRVDPAVFDYRSPVPLFGSGAEAAEHGKRDLTAPGPDAKRKIGRLLRQREALASVAEQFTTEGEKPDA